LQKWLTAKDAISSTGGHMPRMDIVNLMVWNQLKACVPPGTRLTSVRRPPSAQLQFIVSKARQLGYQFLREPKLDDQDSWQGALDFLRTCHYRVAAPGRSPHQTGIAYDLTGPSLSAILRAVRKAAADRRITLAISPSAVLLEPQNNCVHVEVVGAVLLNDALVDIDHVA
jgi:hypothetical protein